MQSNRLARRQGRAAAVVQKPSRAGRRAATRAARGCAVARCAHICALVKVFCQLGKDGEEGWETIGECFFSICQKNKDGEERWQTVGVALNRCQLWSNSV